MTEQPPPSGSTPPPGYGGGSFTSDSAPEHPLVAEPASAQTESTPGSSRLGVWLGIALFVLATLIVILDGSGDDRNSYGIGQVAGTAARDVFLGFVVAFLVNFFIKRSRNQPVSWKRADLKSIEGMAFAIGGGAALVLALALGVPGGSAATGAAAPQGCAAGELSPIDNVPAGSRSEISEGEFAAAFGSQPAGDGQFYSLGAGAGRATLGIVPGANADAALATAAEAEGQRGLAPETVQLGAVSAIKFSNPQRTSYLAKSGCYAIVLAAATPTAADQWAMTLLASATK